MKTKLVSVIILTTIVVVIVFVLVSLQTKTHSDQFKSKSDAVISALGVYPPFYLLAEEADTIDPKRYMKYWDHYRDLEMMGHDDKSTFVFSPELAYYKGMIYPVNRVHTAWQAIQTNLEPGLMRLGMRDIYALCVMQS